MSPVTSRYASSNFTPGIRPRRERWQAASEPNTIPGVYTKVFDPFRLDTLNQCLWRRKEQGNEERVLLKPKAFGILRYLVDHAGRLVTQAELLDAIWPDTNVQPEVLKRHIADIRNVLGDDPKNPTYIETRPWLGYQFIVAVRSVRSREPDSPGIPAQPGLPGMGRALSDLQAHLEKAVGGHRQVVLVTGEPGIGKTTLVDEFERVTAASTSCRIARAQCVEVGAGKEFFCPIPDLLDSLYRDASDVSVAQILAAQAPTWLTQFPYLLRRQQEVVPNRNTPGFATQMPGEMPGEMLSEIVDTLETIASSRPLLLFLEDIHLADRFTINLVSAFAHGRRATKLMVTGTYRPVVRGPLGHPLESIESDLQISRYVMSSSWSRCERWKSQPV